MQFIKVIGDWLPANTIENNEKVYYLVTITNSRESIIFEKYSRYFNDRWEVFHNGKWLPLEVVVGLTWSVTAYIQICDLEPYK